MLSWARLLCLLILFVSSARAIPIGCPFAKLAAGSVGDKESAGHRALRSLQGRRLQQTASSTCSLAFGSNQLSFVGCRSLQSSLDADYNLLYTVTASAGQPTVLHGAIDAASLGWPTFWAGFGIPARPGQMLGSSAIIVQSCSTCASGATVNSYYLGGYDSRQVKPPGGFTVLNMQAQTSSNGRLQAYFEIALNQTADALQSSPLAIIYATGEASEGEIQAHAGDQGVADTLDLSSALSSQSPNASATATPLSTPTTNSLSPTTANTSTPATAPTTALASAPAAAPATVPAAALPSPLLGVNASSTPVNVSSTGSSTGGASIEGVPAAAAPPASATGNATTGGCVLQSTTGMVAYPLCQALLFSTSAKLYWSLDSSSSPVVLHGAMEAVTTGWLGFGLPTTPGVMQGASALIAKPCPTCPSGASIDNYYLADYSSSSVQPPGKLQVSQMNASVASGRIFAQFSLLMTQTAQELAAGVATIYAQGPVSSDGTLQQHALSNSFAASINFGSGSTVEQTTNNGQDAKVHGILMVTGFGILIPLGVLVARIMKPLDPLWFHLHRACQILGLCLGIAGFVFGLRLGHAKPGALVRDHKAIGYTIVAAALLQLLFGFARVQKGARWRLQWAWFHRLLGLSTMLLAVSNVFVGLCVGRPGGLHKFVAGYIAYIAVILAAALAGTSINYCRARKAETQFLQAKH